MMESSYSDIDFIINIFLYHDFKWYFKEYHIITMVLVQKHGNTIVLPRQLKKNPEKNYFL